MKKRTGMSLAVAVALIGANTVQAAYTDALNINLTGNTYGGIPNNESVGLPNTPAQIGSFGFGNNWSQLRITQESSATIDTYLGGDSYWRIYPGSNLPNTPLSPAGTIQTSNGDNVTLATSGTGSGFHIQGSQTTGGSFRWGEQSSSPGYTPDRGLLNGATLNNTEAGSASWTLLNVPFASYDVFGFMGVSTQMGTPGDWSWVKLNGASPITASSFTTTWTAVGGAGTYAAFAAFQILEVQADQQVTMAVLGTNSLAITNRSPASVSAGTDFGSMFTNSIAITNTFVVTNAGDSVLYLTDTNNVVLTGDTGYFSVNTNGMTTNIAAKATTSFTISFNPAAQGTWTGVVSIANSDTNNNPYSFSIRGIALTRAGHIRVLGTNALEIANSAPAAVPEGTDFGAVFTNTVAITNTFAITNFGGDYLYLTNSGIMSVTGDTGYFAVITNGMTTNIAANASTSFKISYNPSALGAWTGIVSIASSDTNSNPYSFSIRGAAIAKTPQIGVLGTNSLAIANGAPAAVPAGSDFGSIPTNASMSHVFSITNSGSGPLYLTNAPVITLTGDTACFSVNTNGMVANIAAAASTTFEISFNPNSVGAKTGLVAIASSDTNANPYVFAVAGTGEPLGSAGYIRDALNINLTGNTYGSGESVGLPLTGSNQEITDGFRNNWSQLQIQVENALSIDTATSPSYWRIYTPPSTISALSPANTIQTSTGDNVLMGASAFHIQGSQTTGGAFRWGEQSSSPYGSHANDRGLLNGATLNNTGVGSASWTLVNVPFASYEVYGFMGTSTQMGTPGDWSWIKLSGASPITESSFTVNWTDVGGVGMYQGFAAFRILDVQEQGTMSVLGTNSLAITNHSPATVSAGTDFGSMFTNSIAITNTFVVTNAGGGVLYLTDTNNVVITGDTSYFAVITNGMTTSIEAKATTSFTISFNPAAPGTWTGVVSIANSDTNNNPYSFSIRGIALTRAGHIRVLGTNALEIANSAPAAVPEGTDFGAVFTNTVAITNTFAITNFGGDALYLTNPDILALTGDTGYFAVITDGMTTNIAANASTSFKISFNPSAMGTWTGVVSIASSDTNNSPYSFSIRGAAIARTPQIGVLGTNSLAIANGAPAAVPEGSDFGSVPTNSSMSHVFSITNSGSDALHLTNSQIITLTGDIACFSVNTNGMVTNIAPAASTTFEISFNPNSLGTKTGLVAIASSDTNANPYVFAVAGTGEPGNDGYIRDALNINLTGNTYGSGESVGLPLTGSNQEITDGFRNNWSQLRITQESAASIDTATPVDSYWRIYTPPSTISALSPDYTIQTSTGSNVLMGASAFHIQGSQTTGDAFRWGEQSSSPYGSHANDRGLLNGATLNNTGVGSASWTLVNVPFGSYEVYGFMGTSTQMGTPADWSWVKLSGDTPVTASTFTTTWTDVGGVGTYQGFAAFRIVMVAFVPIVDNEPGATDPGGVHFSLNGHLLAQGVSPADLTVCWGPSDGGTNLDSWTNKFNFGFTTNGAYSYLAGPLALNTEYYYRYYATNTDGFGWAPSTINFISQGGTTIIIK